MDNKKVSLQDLVEGLVQRKNISKKEAETFVRTVFDVIEESLLAEHLVKVKGIGTFKLVTVDSRESINVNTGERITIDSHAKVSFTPDKVLSDHVNRPFADFETVVLNDSTSTEEMERVEKPEPVAEQVVIPDTKPDTKPVVEPVEEPQEEPVAEPVAEAEPEPVAETEPEPVAEAEPESIVEAEPETTPVAETVMETEPVAEPEPKEQTEVAPPTNPSDKRSHGLWWLLLLLLVLVLIGWLYMSKKNLSKDAVPQEPVIEQVEGTTQPEDTIVAPEPEKSAEETGRTAGTTHDVQKLAADYPQIENGEYWIVGTKAVHVLEKGEDLSKLALETYGDKRMINYIIRYNHYSASKASNLFVGTEVKLPELIKKD